MFMKKHNKMSDTVKLRVIYTGLSVDFTPQLGQYVL